MTMKAFFVGLLAFTSVWKGCMFARFAYFGVPGFVYKGQSVWLDCGYDLENDALYSVKWYKDNLEFYRYLPSDKPSAQMFNLDGVYLDLCQSNATHAFLYKSEMETEGEYSCEVSTEIPIFRTYKVTKKLYVYVIPDGDPSLLGVKNKYPIGTEVNVSCVFGPSKPAAELAWYINGEKVPSAYIRHKQVVISENDLKTSQSRLAFVVDPSHFRQGVLSLQCAAVVSLVYFKTSLELKITDGVSEAEFLHDRHGPPGMEGPNITGNEQSYSVGSPLVLNCTSARSLEVATLQWYVNDEKAKPEFLTKYPIIKYPDDMVSTRLGLHFQVQKEHFQNEEMRLKCIATFAETYRRSTEEKISVAPQRASGYQISDFSKSGWSYIADTSVKSIIVFAFFFIQYLR